MPNGGYRGTFAGAAVIAVRDQHTLSALEGARVTVDGDDAGTTDESGTVRVSRETIERIEVRAEGYYATAYVGAEGEVVTVLMRREPRELARITGVVAGHEAIAAPAGTMIRTRIGEAAAGDRVSLPAVEIATCEGAGACEFEATAWPGVATRWFAQIEAVDDGGTLGTTADDIVTPLSFAMSEAIVAGPNEVREGVQIERFEESEVSSFRIELPGSIGGAAVVGVPGVGVDDAALFFGAHRGQEGFLLPAARGELGDSRRWAVALASRDDGSQSASVVRAEAGESVDVLGPPALREIPEVRREGGQIALTEDGPRALLEVWEESEQRWTLVFDGRSRIEATGPAQIFVWYGPEQDDGLDLRELRSSFTGWIAVPVP